ncbi:MAG TPA: LLM class flavin-dependent oxidoreductase [Terriglobales bacterium]|nr:LLM class flavin-dependent oxidoreductase [Terriglobales bacterium]
MAIRFSIAFQGSKPLKEYIRLARMVEQYDFDAITVYDDLMFKPTWPILTLIAEHTERVQVGPAIVHPFLVHPAYTAGNLAELDEISEGRAILGIGRGAFYEFLGIHPERPITAVREAIRLIRRLLAGDRTPFQGQVFTATPEASLRWKPLRADVPIFVGTWGPKMCQVAGELATETKSDCLWNPDYVKIIRQNIDMGARRAGRDPKDIGIAAGPLCAISNDREAARKMARLALAVYLPYLHPMTEVAGIAPEEIRRVREAAARGNFEEGATYVSDLSVQKCSVAGRPSDVIPQMETMIAAGVTHIAFGHPLGPDFEQALHLIGREIIPRFRR